MIQLIYYCLPQTTAVPVLLSTLTMDLCSSPLLPPNRMVSLIGRPLLPSPSSWVNERLTKTMMEAKNCTIRLFIVKSSKARMEEYNSRIVNKSLYFDFLVLTLDYCAFLFSRTLFWGSV